MVWLQPGNIRAVQPHCGPHPEPELHGAGDSHNFSSVQGRLAQLAGLGLSGVATQGREGQRRGQGRDHALTGEAASWDGDRNEARGWSEWLPAGVSGLKLDQTWTGGAEAWVSVGGLGVKVTIDCDG